MGTTEDNANVAAVALLRIAAEDAEAAGAPTGRMENFICDLMGRNGSAAVIQLSITLARKHCILLDAVAGAIGVAPETLLDAPPAEDVNGMQDA